jgi:hypothetical protein
MNRHLKRLILLGIIYAIFFSSLAGQAVAFDFIISNTSDEKVTLHLYWHDHKLDYYGPFALHAGEYDPKEVHMLSGDYSGKSYTVMITGDEWRLASDFEFEYEQPPKTVVIRWNGCRVSHEMK